MGNPFGLSHFILSSYFFVVFHVPRTVVIRFYELRSTYCRFIYTYLHPLSLCLHPTINNLPRFTTSPTGGDG